MNPRQLNRWLATLRRCRRLADARMRRKSGREQEREQEQIEHLLAIEQTLRELAN